MSTSNEPNPKGVAGAPAGDIPIALPGLSSSARRSPGAEAPGYYPSPHPGLITVEVHGRTPAPRLPRPLIRAMFLRSSNHDASTMPQIASNTASPITMLSA